jgi:hypothetical protein
MTSSSLVLSPDDGVSLTLEVRRSELAEVFSADLLDRMVGEIQGALPQALDLGIAQSALELLGQLNREATNKEILNERSDSRRADRKAKLAWRMVAEDTARGRGGNAVAEYLRLWLQFEELIRLGTACERARGRRRPPTIGPAAPESRSGRV